MMSWQDDRELAVLWTPHGSGKPQIQVLDTAAARGSLLALSRLLVGPAVRFGRYSGLSSAPVTAAGQAMFALMSAPHRQPHGPGSRLAVVEFSARTGMPERVITQSQESGMDSFAGCSGKYPPFAWQLDR